MNLAEVRSRLAEQYRQGLQTKIELLSAERSSLAGGNTDAATAVKWLAHQLRGSGTSFGHPRITAAAAEVESAADSELVDALDELISVMQEGG